MKEDGQWGGVCGQDDNLGYAAVQRLRSYMSNIVSSYDLDCESYHPSYLR